MDSESKYALGGQAVGVPVPIPLSQRITKSLLHWGVETHGISPTSLGQRLDKRLYHLFFVWFSANMNVLAFSTGCAGPAFFNLGLRDTLLILLLVDIVSSAIPAFFAVFGPKLGTRAMVHARFSWGYYGSMIPSILNVLSMQGFLILNSIVGGQTLASVSHHLDDTTGIIIIGVLSLILSFLGYKVIHWYETIAWIPNVIAFIVMLGVGGKHLKLSNYPTNPPPSVQTRISFTTFVASSIFSWCTMTPDYGVYHDAKASSYKIFFYTYFGLLTSSVPAQMLGGAFAAMAPAISSWNEGFDDGNNLGGLISAILSPTGGFGKFLVVLISLSIPSICAPTMYTFGTSFMAIAPIFARVPRYLFSIVSGVILIPLGILGAKRFFGTIVNVLSIIGYWTALFSAIIIVEHVIFKKRNLQRYNVDHWDKPQWLPSGIAATLASLGGIGIIVPCMSQAWYIGPIAKHTGDIGVFVGFLLAGILYFLIRLGEVNYLQVTSKAS
ncbi:hypothetical protein H2248_011344 [Termitomyces sp. 'cryptogamus']|nr:hypothetical protein H2248_011344 [Termitomyces sp. 'cryptogamus']